MLWLLPGGDWVIAAIVGSRSGLDWARVRSGIKAIVSRADIGTVVSGGALGVDRIAESMALAAGKRVRVFYPDWEKYGRSAGMRRNREIVSLADEVFAFWDGKSRGTKNSIETARKLGKTVHVFEVPV